MVSVALDWLTSPNTVTATGFVTPVCSVKSISVRYVVFAAPAVTAVDTAVAAVAVCENPSQFEVPAALYVTEVPPHSPVGALLMPKPNVVVYDVVDTCQSTTQRPFFVVFAGSVGSTSPVVEKAVVPIVAAVVLVVLLPPVTSPLAVTTVGVIAPGEAT
jgi:hypothetical protein